MLQTLARNRVSISRTSNQIIEPITPTTLTDGGTPVTVTVSALNTARYESVVSISTEPAPSAGTGSIQIDGLNEAGASISEDIAISTSGVAQGTTTFASVTQVILKGSALNNCAITIRFIGRDGGSIKARRVLAACQQAQIQRGRGNWQANREGTIQREVLRILLPYICDTQFIPREGDMITDLDTNTEFLVTGAPLIQQVGISRFYDLAVERFQAG